MQSNTHTLVGFPFESIPHSLTPPPPPPPPPFPSPLLFLKVGQNITFLDLTTPTERVSLGENVTFHVNCPAASDVTYTFDFGDGTTFTAEEINAVTTSSHSIAEVTSADIATITHTVSQTRVCS